jgi:hypothetical protein
MISTKSGKPTAFSRVRMGLYPSHDESTRSYNCTTQLSFLSVYIQPEFCYRFV